MIIDRSIIAILIAIILLATWVATTFPKDIEFSNPPCYYYNEPGGFENSKSLGKVVATHVAKNIIAIKIAIIDLSIIIFN